VERTHVMDFQVFHRYNRLARRGIVEPLRCPYCEEEVVTRAQGDQPVLQCFNCDLVVDPGVGLYDRIRAVVTEHFLD